MDNKKIKILLVDDEQTIRETYADIFRQEGFDILEAADGLDGFDLATKENPDVIFTGIIMPRMDGFAMKEAISKNASTANIPVIMLSHMGREEDRQKAESLGIKDFIIQGMVSPKEIIQRIKALFGSSEYHIKINVGDLEAVRLAKDFDFGSGFKCSRCSNEMVLSLKVAAADKREFSAKFVCPKCG